MKQFLKEINFGSNDTNSYQIYSAVIISPFYLGNFLTESCVQLTLVLTSNEYKRHQVFQDNLLSLEKEIF